MRLLLVSVSCVACVGISHAADLPVKAPPRAPVAEIIDWTGLYLGAHAGYGWGDKTWTVGAQPQIAPFSISGNIDGALGGFHGGYNYQIGQFVLGVEGQWTWSDVKGTHSGTFAGFTNTFNVNADWFSSITGRAGYAVGRWLVFADGGAVWAREKYSAQLGAFPVVFETNDTRLGWTVGGGVEYAIDRNWSLRAEYSYMNFESGRNGRGLHFNQNLRVVPVPPPVPPPPPPVPPPGIFDSDLDQNMHLIKVGLTYRFSPTPLLAKY